MKKLLSLLLAAALLLSAGAVPAFADDLPDSIWNAKDKAFRLKEGPEIVRIAADSTEDGTRATAYYNCTAAYKTLADAYRTAFTNDYRLFANALGTDVDGTDADLEVGVQIAYSFDGKNWVNDWETDDLEEDYRKYYIQTDFDFDEDDFEEYRNLPSERTDLSDLFGSVTLFDGCNGDMTPSYCYPADGMSIKQALTIRNNAILQGKGEYTGSAYKKDDANWGKGFAIDFNQHTLYVKARYRVYNWTDVRDAEGEWHDSYHVYWSDWGPVKTFNNKTASAEKQNCAPDVSALNTKAAPTLTLLATDRGEKEEDGVTLKTASFQLGLRYPAATETALAKFYALGNGYVREALTGEYYDPDFWLEIRVGSGNWYVLDHVNFNHPYYCFDDDVYWIRDQLEAMGYQPGDPVYLRASLYGDDSKKEEHDEATDCNILSDSDTVFIKTARSNVVELSLTGKFNIRYETNGGSFPYGTHRLEQFDEDTLVNVDLTSKDYTPERKNFTFGGWYTTEKFTKGTEIKAFDTAEKASRTYYAKWTELPYRTVGYDLGPVTDYVYNPNPDRVYTDDGEVEIGGVDYAGAKFLGWYDAAQGGSKVTKLSYDAMKGNITLYARWELPTKTISYDGAGKDYTNNELNPTSYRINPNGSNLTLIYAPEKRGHIFDGWYLDKDLEHGKLAYSEENCAYLLDESEDVTLYAKWIRGRWDITYELNLTDAWNGGNPESYTYGTAVKLAEPSRTGYTFGGWFADEGLKTKVTAITATDVGEKTLYAKWTAIKYKINYDLRDTQAGAFFTNPNPSTRTVDDEVILQPLAPKSDLYLFFGWYDNVNFDGKPVDRIAAGTAKDVTLYAKWIYGQWNITYRLGLDGAWNGGNPDTYQYGAALKLEDPVRMGYTFEGWFADAEFTTPVTQIAADATGDKILYAKWSAVIYKISYDLGDPQAAACFTNPNPEKRAAGEEIVLQPLKPASKAYAFLGWYDNAGFSGEPVARITGDTNRDVTLYAKLEPVVKTITYDGAGKDYTNNELNPASYQLSPEGPTETLIYAPEKTGYIFDGWYLNKDLEKGKLAYDETRGAWLLQKDVDVTLYAKWILGRWDIRYELNLTEVWNGDNPESYTYGTAVTLADPTRTGYTFEGWFADKDLKTKVTEITDTDVGEKTLYAKWTAVIYKVRFDLRDPQAANFFGNPRPATRTVDEEMELQPLVPAYKLYKFLGWYDNANFDGSPVEKIEKGTDRDVTLFAKLFKYSWGDVNFDGKVSSADARLVLRYSVGLEDFTPEMLAWADVDAPSAERKISSADARLVLRMSVNLDSDESLKLPELPEDF